MKQVLFVFATTHDALKAEQLLEAEGIAFRPQPVPGSIQSGCGLGVALAADQYLLGVNCLHAGSLHFRAWRLLADREPELCDS